MIYGGVRRLPVRPKLQLRGLCRRRLHKPRRGRLASPIWRFIRILSRNGLGSNHGRVKSPYIDSGMKCSQTRLDKTSRSGASVTGRSRPCLSAFRCLSHRLLSPLSGQVPSIPLKRNYRLPTGASSPWTGANILGFSQYTTSSHEKGASRHSAIEIAEMDAVPLQRLLEVLPDKRRQPFGVLLSPIQRRAFRRVDKRLEVRRRNAAQSV
jgi:hypothetical protein